MEDHDWSIYATNNEGPIKGAILMKKQREQGRVRIAASQSQDWTHKEEDDYL